MKIFGLLNLFLLFNMSYLSQCAFTKTLNKCNKKRFDSVANKVNKNVYHHTKKCKRFIYKIKKSKIYTRSKCFKEMSNCKLRDEIADYFSNIENIALLMI